MQIVQTVLGDVAPHLLGRTLTHEHISLNFTGYYCAPPTQFNVFLERAISLENVGYVRQYPYSSLENLRFYGKDTEVAVRKDMELYKKFGGGTIVENSSHGLGRNLKYMVDVSNCTGVHIIAGTGHYVHDQQLAEHGNMTLEQMANLYLKEISVGVDVEDKGTVKCGFIGEVGSTFPIHEFEKRAIRAAGETQEVLGCGVSFHPGRSRDAPFEIMRLYLEAGGRADKCIMSHLDRTIYNIEELLDFSQLGCYIQYDLFGTECSFYQLNQAVDMPSDAQRINNLILLIKEGLLDRLLMSHDIHTKHRLTSFGGHGYHHLHTNILPRMLAKGVTADEAEYITVRNPANWLQFKA